MPKVNLGKPDYEKILSAEIDCAIKRSFLDKEKIGKMTGVTKRTVYYKLAKPSSISLGWLKLFVKVTNMDPNVILNYLYEGKYHVRTEP